MELEHPPKAAHPRQLVFVGRQILHEDTNSPEEWDLNPYEVLRAWWHSTANDPFVQYHVRIYLYSMIKNGEQSRQCRRRGDLIQL